MADDRNTVLKAREQALTKFFTSMLDSFLDHAETVDERDLKAALLWSGLGYDVGYGIAGCKGMGIVLTDLGQSIRRTIADDL